MYKLTLYVPESHLESVRDSLFRAGAGKYRNYDRCCWQVRGMGQFRPLNGSNPYLGEELVDQHVAEFRVEMICEDTLVKAVATALREAHPYEEPAFDFVRIDEC